jgi:hypothetical protein
LSMAPTPSGRSCARPGARASPSSAGCARTRPCGRCPTRRRPRPYGDRRISLAKRAGPRHRWQHVACVPYGKAVVKTIKTFQATYQPAGGLIRVVLVKEADDGLPSFSTNPDAPPRAILEGMADAPVAISNQQSAVRSSLLTADC